MTIEEYKRLLGKGSLQRQYFEILQDGVRSRLAKSILPSNHLG